MVDKPDARPPLPQQHVDRIRRERLDPRVTQWDYLHLRALRRGIARAIAQMAPWDDPVLDVWCGAKPYAPMVPATTVGLDVDRHFGAADVLGHLPFPFRDDVFAAAVCTQALHIVDEPAGTMSEISRVVRPGGAVVVTVPEVMLRAGPSAFEGRCRAQGLRTLLSDWVDVRITPTGGPGTTLAHAIGLVVDAAHRRLRWPWGALAAVMVVVNTVGLVIDALAGGTLERRWPHLLVATARMPVPGGVPDTGGTAR